MNAAATRQFIRHTGTAISSFSANVYLDSGAGLALGAVGVDGVVLSRSAAGVMRMIGFGGVNNEGLDWDFDPATADTIDVQSSTGAGLGFNLPAIVFGTTPADPTVNWQALFAPGTKTISIGGDFARRLFSAAGVATVDAALTTFFTDVINEPFGAIGAGSVVDAGNVLIQTSVSIGTNRYGLLITSNPAGGTLNYALRVTNGDSRFDARVDINNGIALGGGVAPTLGTIGGAGPTAAAQAQWVEIDVAGVPHWIPAWV